MIWEFTIYLEAEDKGWLSTILQVEYLLSKMWQNDEGNPHWRAGRKALNSQVDYSLN